MLKSMQSRDDIKVKVYTQNPIPASFHTTCPYIFIFFIKLMTTSYQLALDPVTVTALFYQANLDFSAGNHAIPINCNFVLQ